MASTKKISEKHHTNNSSATKSKRGQKKTPGNQNDKVTQASQVDIDYTVGHIRKLFEIFLDETKDLTPSDIMERLQITDKQRGLIFLCELHESLEGIKKWERVLIELLVDAKMSQTKIAKKIDVSPNTINRWIHDPITIDLNEIDIEIERQRGNIP